MGRSKHNAAGASASRRDILKGGAATSTLGALGAMGGLAQVFEAAAKEPAKAPTKAPAKGAAKGPKGVPGHVASYVPSAATLDLWLKKLHAFGPIRATGTKQANAFEDFLHEQFGNLGCDTTRWSYKLTSWECDIKDCAIEVKEDGGANKTLEVIAYYPFGGSTKGKEPAKGRIIFGGEGEDCGPAILKAHTAAELANSIVVVDMPLKGGGVRGTVKYYPDSFPNPLPELADAPHVASQGGRGPMQSLEGKCQGLILCYTDVSDEAARYNYLPFSDQHRKMPAVWVGKESSDYLKSVAGKAKVSVRCDAKLTPGARSDTVLAVLPGETDEVILMTTQTDGPNECNENGGLGLLACATYLSKVKKRKRTVVFSLPTGHYAAGAIRDPVTGSGEPPGTSGVIFRHPEYASKAVAQIALEQMAAMEWADIDGKWQATKRPAQENWIPTPQVHDTINTMFMASTTGLDAKYSRSGLVESGQAPGEGGVLRQRGIPGIGLMGSPHYFFRADPKGVIDKLSPNVMHNQIMIVTRMLALMDRLTPGQLAGKEPITPEELGQA